MSSKYNINKQDNGNYDIYQIKLDNGKKCLYWNKKGSNNFTDIIVIFHNDNVSDIKDNQIFLSFDGIKDVNDINNFMIAFGTEVYKNGLDITKIGFKFIVDNREEVSIVNDLMSKYKIKGEFVYSDKYSQLTENLDAAINEIASDNKRNDSAHSVDQIKKYENGTYKKYIVHDNKVYDDNDTLDYNEKKERILNDLKNDSSKLFNALDKPISEINDMVNKEIASNLKTHYMEDGNDEKNIDSYGSVSSNKAYSEDGKVNPELGIIKNSPKNENEYSVVENDNHGLRIVNPSVSKSNTSIDGKIKSRGVDSSFWDDDNSLFNSIQESVQERDDELPLYYIGSSNEIYNKFGKIVGRVGVGGYQVNGDNNLVLYDKVVGSIGDINDMGRDAARANSNVRVFKKHNNAYLGTNKQAAFISLPVVIFVISLFLLIVSGIILFLMK